MGKPASAADAREGWRQQNYLSRRRRHVVKFGVPPPGDLSAYIERGESLAVAGGFTLDGLGGWFIDGEDGDPSAVIGIACH